MKYRRSMLWLLHAGIVAAGRQLLAISIVTLFFVFSLSSASLVRCFFQPAPHNSEPPRSEDRPIALAGSAMSGRRTRTNATVGGINQLFPG
jgi:hypothetical protein